MRTTSMVVGFVAALAACGGSDEQTLRVLGDYCSRSEQCESGMCGEGPWNSRRCTRKCDTIGEACSEAEEFVCREDSECGLRCEDGEGNGNGYVCEDGVLRTCGEADETNCEACGCDAFGGGMCEPGKGCTPLAELGQACAGDQYCASGICDPETNTCIVRRAMGEACTRDVQCESQNCSNDGNITVAGKCNQELGTGCDSTSETCSSCQSNAFGSRCNRLSCDPETAPNCGAGWECAGYASDGTRVCAQVCDDPALTQCFSDLATCRDGYCY